MEEEVKYTSEFDGQTTDEVLKHAKSVKDLTIPSLSNISGFVCIDNEGKAIGMMSKEQVASVVGGLIGKATYKKDGLMSKSDKVDFISKKGYFNGDINTLTSPGCYTLSGGESIINSPGKYGAIVVLPSDYYIPQLFMGASSIQARISLNKEGSDWSEWKQLS